ncbi:hypothetical protein PIB30_056820 [Stylosanthes scabra]|uniref:Aminotransferase-like plant mobile domain-containing protein n=1 Tax=Stylosanthes scabra TaxID=79078 RepID=A0ABU6ULI0_9FABA|nr:hypothetical protein [Stylosanthes scabra]
MARPEYRYVARVEWHQVDRAVRQFGSRQHIPSQPLNIDEMHVHDGRWGRGEWYPEFLQGWYEMWRGRAAHRLPLDLHPDLWPSQSYLEWYIQQPPMHQPEAGPSHGIVHGSPTGWYQSFVGDPQAGPSAQAGSSAQAVAFTPLSFQALRRVDDTTSSESASHGDLRGTCGLI